uniref:Uncharacterized protein n=1 Tax=viral metagenome TaxID=1070528 RepID=A0A6C0H5P8_9ZZZZ
MTNKRVFPTNVSNNEINAVGIAYNTVQRKKKRTTSPTIKFKFFRSKNIKYTNIIKKWINKIRINKINVLLFKKQGNKI